MLTLTHNKYKTISITHIRLLVNQTPKCVNLGGRVLGKGLVNSTLLLFSRLNREGFSFALPPTLKGKKMPNNEQELKQLRHQLSCLQGAVDKSITRLEEMFKRQSAANINTLLKVTNIYAKYNAKLRRLEQEEAKFFRWNCIILSCGALLMSILMWWCE